MKKVSDLRDLCRHVESDRWPDLRQVRYNGI